jgi:transposase
MKDFLSERDVKEFEKLHRQCKDKRQADRIKTILLLNKGYSFAQITEILLLDDSTLRNYYAEYAEGGMERLLKDNYSGGTSRLSCQQIEALDEHLQKHTYTRSKEIQAYIRKEFGIDYTTEGIKAMLYRMGYSYKKAKHVPGKADQKRQEAFVEEYEKLKAGKRPEDSIYFMDGCHPMHNSIEAYGWIKKGTDKELKANTGRQRLNLNGAYNAETHQVVIREDEQINAQSTLSLIRQIMLLQVTGTIYLIADNAKYYRSRLVQEFLEQNPRVKMIFLPPYSPNLNLIERLWLFFKKKRLWNTYYEKYADFKKESMSFFENLHLYREELKSLMTDNFHIIRTA